MPTSRASCRKAPTLTIRSSLAGDSRPNERFRELCNLAEHQPKTNFETGEVEPWVLKDLRKTCATYHDEHVPESSIEILGHSVGGITYRHYAHRAPLAFKAIMTLPQPPAFLRWSMDLTANARVAEGRLPMHRKRSINPVRVQNKYRSHDFNPVESARRRTNRTNLVTLNRPIRGSVRRDPTAAGAVQAVVERDAAGVDAEMPIHRGGNVLRVDRPVDDMFAAGLERPIAWPIFMPPPPNSTLKVLPQWSRPALALMRGVRPNSPIATISVLSYKPR